MLSPVAAPAFADIDAATSPYAPATPYPAPMACLSIQAGDDEIALGSLAIESMYMIPAGGRRLLHELPAALQKESGWQIGL